MHISEEIKSLSAQTPPYPPCSTTSPPPSIPFTKTSRTTCPTKSSTTQTTSFPYPKFPSEQPSSKPLSSSSSNDNDLSISFIFKKHTNLVPPAPFSPSPPPKRRCLIKLVDKYPLPSSTSSIPPPPKKAKKPSSHRLLVDESSFPVPQDDHDEVVHLKRAIAESRRQHAKEQAEHE